MLLFRFRQNLIKFINFVLIKLTIKKPLSKFLPSGTSLVLKQSIGLYTYNETFTREEIFRPHRGVKINRTFVLRLIRLIRRANILPYFKYGCILSLQVTLNGIADFDQQTYVYTKPIYSFIDNDDLADLFVTAGLKHDSRIDTYTLTIIELNRNTDINNLDYE